MATPAVWIEEDDIVSVSRDRVLSLAVSVLAFEELFLALEREDGAPSIGDAGAHEARAFVRDTFGIVDANDAHDQDHPLLVELHAKARERAAQMLRTAAQGENAPLTFNGSPYTAFGLRRAAANLETEARLTREQRSAWPELRGFAEPTDNDLESGNIRALEDKVDELSRRLGALEPR